MSQEQFIYNQIKAYIFPKMRGRRTDKILVIDDHYKRFIEKRILTYEEQQSHRLLKEIIKEWLNENFQPI
jgi:hypothetical protein